MITPGSHTITNNSLVNTKNISQKACRTFSRHTRSVAPSTPQILVSLFSKSKTSKILELKEKYTFKLILSVDVHFKNTNSLIVFALLLVYTHQQVNKRQSFQ